MSTWLDGRTSRRLRFDTTLNPKKSRLELGLDEDVSFVPMEAVGIHGGLALDGVRLLSDVCDGYTYFSDGDVCVAKITPCFENGKGALAHGLVNATGFGTTELHVIRPKATIDPRFLFYLTISHDFREIGTSEMVGSGGQKRVPEQFIKEWSPSLPEVGLQRRIARFLDAKTARIDALIEKKQALLERLAEKRQALITNAVTKGLDPDVPMKDSGIEWLGKIPTHWGVRRLCFSVEKIEQGWSPQCDNRPAGPGEWGVLKVGCVNSESYDESDNKALPANLTPIAQYEVCEGDILISRANTKELLGSAALVTATQGNIIFSDKLYRIHLSGDIDSRFLIGALRSPLARFQYEQDATGTSGSMQNIGQDTIKNLLHPLPPFIEQQQIGNWLERVSSGDSQLEGAVRSSVGKLQEYRSALITAAETGQIANFDQERAPCI